MTKSATKCCFVVGAIGDEDSPERIHADWLLEAIIEPVFETLAEFVVERADKISHPGLIDAQIINKLLTAELVVADLTGLNPNAFYEIGIRHMAQKPIIHMHEAGQKIPFDVSLYRSIKFSRIRPRDIQSAKVDLKKMVDQALALDYQVENPVTNVRGRVEFEKHATPEQQLLIEQLRSIEERLSEMEMRGTAPLTPAKSGQGHRLLDDHISFFSVGDLVRHHKFGLGPVLNVDGAKLTVRFPIGTKRVVDAFVTPATRSDRSEFKGVE
jgi:hypothetical protein